ncbi:RAB6A-GEF complex partner protein 2 [Wickerhamiella sorbophila]|uniref:RAB6A-GEF complex partner protein 2 n=1 Tax=Wickerhamiella sorbophila TaxID=45607 RepID=A0A2T0FBU9_9ASCO|nr:RAB6A-GEF complex partner protein 2 [Wickerhamiella sorbophila]PRT52478.1 RAB6A-GEF complex partner protein 2 [Wickerhamiella sorbophila]
MHVEAAIDGPLIFVGDTLSAKISFTPQRSRRRSSGTGQSDSTPVHLLAGYAIVQGTFRLGDQILPESFEATRNSGVVVGNHGVEYGYGSMPQSGLLSSMWGGLRNLVAKQPEDDFDEAQDIYPVFNTPQQLLFTDLVVKHPVSFDFVAELPSNLPPTYRSRALSISYQLVIGFQHFVNDAPEPTQLFLPFRVYPLGAASSFDLTKPLTPETAPTTKSQTMQDFIDNFVNESQSSSPAEKPAQQLSYNVAKNGEQIATVHFARSPARIGDAIEAVVELAQPCLHLTARLELCEVIDEEIAAGAAQAYQTFTRQTMATTALDRVALHLPLLHGTTPLLNTKQIQSSWSLRLEFVGLVGTYYSDSSEQEKIAKASLNTEVFSCRLPISVLAPDSGGHGTSKSWSIH